MAMVLLEIGSLKIPARKTKLGKPCGWWSQRWKPLDEQGSTFGRQLEVGIR